VPSQKVIQGSRGSFWEHRGLDFGCAKFAFLEDDHSESKTVINNYELAEQTYTSKYSYTLNKHREMVQEKLDSIN
jgi:hypothetical protein